jgi:hypothetical protein
MSHHRSGDGFAFHPARDGLTWLEPGVTRQEPDPRTAAPVAAVRVSQAQEAVITLPELIEALRLFEGQVITSGARLARAIWQRVEAPAPEPDPEREHA